MSSVDFLADLGSSAEARAVARVLSAAAAPPWPHELRGYEAARTAFEKAGGTPVRRGGAVMPLRRLVGVKLAAVAGALTVTGVAVAAEADVLPSPIQRAAHQMLGGVGVPEPDPQSHGGQAMTTSPGSSAPHESPNSGGSGQASGDHSSNGLLPGTPVGTSDTAGQPTSASAGTVALCRAYVAHPGGSGLSDNDRRQLAALAGGEDKIDSFCAQVLGQVSGTPVPQPSGTSNLPITPSTATPDPSRDHKSDSSSSSDPGFDPQTSGAGNSTNGRTHTPDPTATRTGH